MTWQSKKSWVPYVDKGYYCVVVDLSPPSLSDGSEDTSPAGRDNLQEQAITEGINTIADAYGKNPVDFISQLRQADAFSWSKRNKLVTYGIRMSHPTYNTRPGINIVRFEICVLRGFVDLTIDSWKASPSLQSFISLEWAMVVANGIPDSVDEFLAQNTKKVFKNFYSGRHVDPAITNLYEGDPTDHPPIVATVDLGRPPRPWFDKDYTVFDDAMMAEAKLYHYRELKFASFEDFGNQTETLIINLEEQQNQHTRMTKQQFVIPGTEIAIDLGIIGSEIRLLRDQMRSTAISNGLNLTKDRKSVV